MAARVAAAAMVAVAVAAERTVGAEAREPTGGTSRLSSELACAQSAVLRKARISFLSGFTL